MSSLRRPAVAIAAAMAVWLAVSGSAEARTWPTDTIVYASDGTFRYAVGEAVRTWNASGVAMTFRAAAETRRRPQVVIRAVGDPSSGCSADAQVGYVAGRRAPVRVSRGCADDVATAKVIAHELGHVLGLGHERERCSLMNPRTIETAGDRCIRPPAGSWRCRMLEPVDLRRAVRLYGGRARPASRETCPIWSGLAPPQAFQVLDRPGGTDIVYTPPALTKLVRLSTVTDPALSVVVARGGSGGDCPASPEPALATLPVTAGARAARTQRLETYKPVPGRYCYVAWTADSLGRRSAPSPPSIVSVGLPPQPRAEEWRLSGGP